MTTVFEENGKARSVTLLEGGKNFVVGVRKAKKDGYSAVVAGFLKKNIKEADWKKRKNFLSVKEFILSEEAQEEQFNPGQEVSVEQFQPGDRVTVCGSSKGKGYQGVMKRHNFSGSPSTHGHRHDHRAPGSIGCAFPERVFPGKKMAGRMGAEKTTVKKVPVILADKEKNLLALGGAVPGNAGSVVKIFC